MRKDEQGNSSILVLAICCVVLFFAFGLSELGKVQILKTKVQNAADAAALSAAYELSIYEKPKACPSAKRTAEKNGAKVTSCNVSSNSVEIEATDKSDKVFVKAKAEVD